MPIAGRARAPCDHKCGHLHKDLGLQSSAAESTGGCVVIVHKGIVGESSAGAKAVRGCTLMKLGCGGMMCLYIKSVYVKRLLSIRILKTDDNKL